MQQLSEGSNASDLGSETDRRSWHSTPHAECLKEAEKLPNLVRTIETEIIPRLMLALGGAADARLATNEPHNKIEQSDVDKLVALLLGSEVPLVVAYVDDLRAAGVPLDAIYLDLMAPSARELGRMWEEDLCDFTQVTTGLSQLQSLLHQISMAVQPELKPLEHGRRVLLSPLPGEQHTFGLAIVMDFFWRAGWDVIGGPIASERELLRLVRDNWFDIIGLSLGSEKWLDQTMAEIRLIRRESRNPAIGVLVGGPVFSGHPERVAMVGADAWAEDARAAPERAEILLSELEGRRSHAAVGKYF
jgi:methanogenic corrinoid protein MtbC1